MKATDKIHVRANTTNHMLNFHDFIVHPGMLMGYVEYNTPFVTNGLSSDNDVYLDIHFFETKWIKKRIVCAEHQDLVARIYKAGRRRDGNAIHKGLPIGVRYLTPLEIEEQLKKKKEIDEGGKDYLGNRATVNYKNNYIKPYQGGKFSPK